MPCLVNPYIFGSDSYGVKFDSGEYLSRASALSGVSNTKLFTMSLWLVGTHASSFDQTLFYAYNTFGANASTVSVTSEGKLNVGLWTTAGGILSINSTAFLAGSVGLVKHLHFAVDMDSSSTRKLYVNQTEDTSATWTYTTGQTLDMSMTAVDVCKPGTGGGTYAHAWIAPGQFEPDYSKFINADGTPKDLGVDGSTPTGTAPAIYFNGNANDFYSNLGTGGAFTQTGTLSDSTVPLVAL